MNWGEYDNNWGLTPNPNNSNPYAHRLGQQTNDVFLWRGARNNRVTYQTVLLP